MARPRKTPKPETAAAEAAVLEGALEDTGPPPGGYILTVPEHSAEPVAGSAEAQDETPPAGQAQSQAQPGGASKTPPEPKASGASSASGGLWADLESVNKKIAQLDKDIKKLAEETAAKGKERAALLEKAASLQDAAAPKPNHGRIMGVITAALNKRGAINGTDNLIRRLNRRIDQLQASERK